MKIVGESKSVLALGLQVQVSVRAQVRLFPDFLDSFYYQTILG